MNTLSLVQRAVELMRVESAGYDRVWCVFDKDDFSDAMFLEAIALAAANRIEVAYTNQAFELWYLLHFEYHIAALHRNQYAEKLSFHLGRPYRKNDDTLYDILLPLQPIAIAYAKRLLAEYTTHQPAKDNPCTRVHVLVEELNSQVV